MTATFDGSISLRVRGTVSNPLDLSSLTDTLNELFTQTFENGTGTGQANKMWSDTRTLADNTSESLDLAGSLTDSFGAAITFAKIKAIIIRNKSTTQALAVGGAASNQFINWVANSSDIINIPAGGMFMLTAPAGFAVTASTGDLLKIANGSAGQSTDYDIVLFGTV